MDVTILGSGSPLPDAERAGPSGLVSVGGQHFLVDCGRGVLMRLAGAGLGVVNLTAVLLTHLQMGFDRDETVALVRERYDGPVELVDPGYETTIGD